MIRRAVLLFSYAVPFMMGGDLSTGPRMSEALAGNICFESVGLKNKGSFPGAMCVPKASLKLVNQNWLSKSHLVFAKHLPQHKSQYEDSTGYVLSARPGEQLVGTEACTPTAFAMALSVVYGTAQNTTNADWKETSACGKSRIKSSHWESIDCAIQWTSYLMNRGPEQKTADARRAIYTKAVDWMGRLLGTCLNCEVKGTLWNARLLQKGAGKMANPALLVDAFTPKNPSPASGEFLFEGGEAFHEGFTSSKIIHNINSDAQIVAAVMLTPLLTGEANKQMVQRVVPNPLRLAEADFATVAGVPDPERRGRNTAAHAIVISGYQVASLYASPLLHIADPIDGQWKIGQLGTLSSGLINESVAIRIMTGRGFPMNIPVPGFSNLDELLRTPQNILTGLTVQAAKTKQTLPSPTECLWNAQLALPDSTVEHPAFNIGSCGSFLANVPYLFYRSDAGAAGKPPTTIDALGAAYAKSTNSPKSSSDFDYRQRVSFFVNGITLRIR